MIAELDLTLTELEMHDCGPPTFQSHLVIDCHRLRKKPLRDFTTEDLRIMIGQNIGMRHLVPLAVNVLNEEPLAEGNFFPGDLLCNVLKIEASYWKQYPAQRQQMAEIIDKAVKEVGHQEEERQGTKACLEGAIAIFRKTE